MHRSIHDRIRGCPSILMGYSDAADCNLSPQRWANIFLEATLLFASSIEAQTILDLRSVICLPHGYAEGTDLNAQGSDGTPSDKKLAILPASIELNHKDSTQNVQAHYVDRAGVYDAPLREGLRWKSSDESVFRVQDNQVIAVSDGQAQLLLEWEKNRETASVPVQVRSTSEPKSIEFRNHIQAVFCQSRLQYGCMPWSSGWQRWVSTFIARLRRNDRPFQHH